MAPSNKHKAHFVPPIIRVLPDSSHEAFTTLRVPALRRFVESSKAAYATIPPSPHKVSLNGKIYAIDQAHRLPGLLAANGAGHQENGPKTERLSMDPFGQTLNVIDDFYTPSTGHSHKQRLLAAHKVYRPEIELRSLVKLDPAVTSSSDKFRTHIKELRKKGLPLPLLSGWQYNTPDLSYPSTSPYVDPSDAATKATGIPKYDRGFIAVFQNSAKLDEALQFMETTSKSARVLPSAMPSVIKLVQPIPGSTYHIASGTIVEESRVMVKDWKGDVVRNFNISAELLNACSTKLKQMDADTFEISIYLFDEALVEYVIEWMQGSFDEQETFKSLGYEKQLEIAMLTNMFGLRALQVNIVMSLYCALITNAKCLTSDRMNDIIMRSQPDDPVRQLIVDQLNLRFFLLGQQKFEDYFRNVQEFLNLNTLTSKRQTTWIDLWLSELKKREVQGLKSSGATVRDVLMSYRNVLDKFHKFNIEDVTADWVNSARGTVDAGPYDVCDFLRSLDPLGPGTEEWFCTLGWAEIETFLTSRRRWGKTGIRGADLVSGGVLDHRDKDASFEYEEHVELQSAMWDEHEDPTHLSLLEKYRRLAATSYFKYSQIESLVVPVSRSAPDLPAVQESVTPSDTAESQHVQAQAPTDLLTTTVSDTAVPSQDAETVPQVQVVHEVSEASISLEQDTDEGHTVASDLVDNAPQASTAIASVAAPDAPDLAVEQHTGLRLVAPQTQHNMAPLAASPVEVIDLTQDSDKENEDPIILTGDAGSTRSKRKATDGEAMARPSKKSKNAPISTITLRPSDGGQPININAYLLTQASTYIKQRVSNPAKLKAATIETFPRRHIEHFCKVLKNEGSPWQQQDLSSALGVISLAHYLHAEGLRADGITFIKEEFKRTAAAQNLLRDVYQLKHRDVLLQQIVLNAVHWHVTNTSKASCEAICKRLLPQSFHSHISSAWNRLDEFDLADHPCAGQIY